MNTMTYSLLITILISIIFFSTMSYVNSRTLELETFSLEHSQKENEKLLQKEIQISPLNITIK